MNWLFLRKTHRYLDWFVSNVHTLEIYLWGNEVQEWRIHSWVYVKKLVLKQHSPKVTCAIIIAIIIKLEFSKTEVGCSCAQRRAGSIPWAAVALQLFWQVLKSVKKKKKKDKKKKKINLLWIKRPNKLSLNFNSVLHLQHTEMQLTVASVHTR